MCVCVCEVFNVITGGGAMGSVLAAHPDVDKVRKEERERERERESVCVCVRVCVKPSTSSRAAAPWGRCLLLTVMLAR